MDGLWWKTLLKWMIWGTIIFGNTQLKPHHHHHHHHHKLHDSVKRPLIPCLGGTSPDSARDSGEVWVFFRKWGSCRRKTYESWECSRWNLRMFHEYSSINMHKLISGWSVFIFQQVQIPKMFGKFSTRYRDITMHYGPHQRWAPANSVSRKTGTPPQSSSTASPAGSCWFQTWNGNGHRKTPKNRSAMVDKPSTSSTSGAGHRQHFRATTVTVVSSIFMYFLVRFPQEGTTVDGRNHASLGTWDV